MGDRGSLLSVQDLPWSRWSFLAGSTACGGARPEQRKRMREKGACTSQLQPCAALPSLLWRAWLRPLVATTGAEQDLEQGQPRKGGGKVVSLSGLIIIFLIPTT